MAASDVNNIIRKKVEKLIDFMGVSKTRLGQVLSNNSKESGKQNYTRADRFLKGSGNVKIDDLIRISHFFEKPLSYFLGDKFSSDFQLSTSEKVKPKSLRPIQEVEEGLRKMGLDEDFIQEKIQELKCKKKYEHSQKREIKNRRA